MFVSGLIYDYAASFSYSCILFLIVEYVIVLNVHTVRQSVTVLCATRSFILTCRQQNVFHLYTKHSYSKHFLVAVLWKSLYYLATVQTLGWHVTVWSVNMLYCLWGGM